jgi:hypothetical protein
LVTTFTTPSGNPASANASMISAWVRGQVSLALRITLLPQASGTAMARTPRMMGAFHGAMPRITPTGSLRARARQPGLSDGITSPPIWVVNAAASRTMPAARPRLNSAQPLVAPISPIIASTKASARASSAAAAFISTARRAFGPMAAHAGNAAAALPAIAAISPAFIAGALDAASPVIGLMRVNSVMAGSLVWTGAIDECVSSSR